MREEEDVLPADNPDDIYYYGRPNPYQTVLRNTDGRVEIVRGPRGSEKALGPFPWSVAGHDFDDVLERLRALASESE